MTRPTKAPRSYDSTRRRAQAQENRAKMLAAAKDLFVESGYAATTLAAIAARADVALPTLYAVFGSKRSLLAELLEGQESRSQAQVRILDEDQLDRLVEADSATEKIRLYARFAVSHVESSYDLLTALRVAAGSEPEAALLEQRYLGDNHAAIKTFAAHLHSLGLLKQGMSTARAADTLWALSDLQLFSLLVRLRGWRVSKYRTWLADSLVGALLGR